MSDTEVTYITYSVQKTLEMPDIAQLFDEIIPVNAKKAFFEEHFQGLTVILQPIMVRQIQPVPFQPLQIAYGEEPLIPNRRILTSEENHTLPIPACYQSTNTLMYEAYMPRYRTLDDNEINDEDLPHFAQSFKSNYRFSQQEKVQQYEYQLYKRDTFNLGWRAAINHAVLWHFYRLRLQQPEIIDQIIRESPCQKTIQLYNFFEHGAKEISEQFIRLISGSKPLQYNLEQYSQIQNYDFGPALKNLISKHNRCHVPRIPTELNEFTQQQQFLEALKLSQYYLTEMYKYPREQISKTLGDVIYQNQHRLKVQYYNQQNEFYQDVMQRKEALAFISKVKLIHKKKISMKQFLYQQELPLERKKLNIKHPFSLPCVQQRNNFKIQTFPQQSSQFIQMICQNKRLYSIFNRQFANTEQTAYYLSQFHGFGLFSLIDDYNITELTEYCGEVINSLLAEVRDQEYIKNGFKAIYMFQLREDVVIDATFTGSYARFVNHCCNSNCESYSMLLQGHELVPENNKGTGEAYGIGIYGCVHGGEEITMNYHMRKVRYGQKMPCNCGGKSCTGHIN